MNTKFSYLVVANSNYDEFCEAVEELLYSGYTTVGGPFIREQEDGILWYQGMERSLND